MRSLSELEQKSLESLESLLVSHEKQIQENLAQALTTIRGQMSKIYDKYAKDGILSKVEMTAYNKYQTLEKQLLDILAPAIKANIKEIARLAPEMYQESFFHYGWAMDQASGINISYGSINMDTITELYSITNPKNIELMNALKNYPLNAKKYIRNALLNGLTIGKSYGSMVKDFQNALNKSAFEALRIIRTEGQRAINKGQDDLYMKAIEAGVEGNMVWDATLDHRTRPDHGRMDGVKKSADGYYHGAIGKAQYPGDPNLPADQSINCRCHERFEIDGYSPQLRRTRDGGIIPYTKYDEWIKDKG